MKLVIDDAVWGYEKIFSEFGNIVALPGRNINRENVLDCDALIIRSRTTINKELLEGTNVRFVGSTVAGLDHVDEAYLEKNNIKCEVVIPMIDEEPINESLVKQGASPEIISKNLAELKANKVSNKKNKELVLGADSVIDLEKLKLF